MKTPIASVLIAGIMAFNISHAENVVAINTNKVPDFIASWVTAANNRDIESMRALIDEDASIKSTHPITRMPTTVDREEWLRQISDLWKLWPEYKLSILDSRVLGNTLFLRINQFVKEKRGSVSRNAAESIELKEIDDRLVVVYMEIIPDETAVRIPTSASSGTPEAGRP